jgi:predicted nucleic acid-binding protein
MITAVDTNAIVALWSPEPVLNQAAQAALDMAHERGGLVICAPVFAELMASPGRSEQFLRLFLSETAIAVDWTLEEAIWRAAGFAFQTYAARRRRQGNRGPRRILADFLIGAHAQHRGYSLLTLDSRLYGSAFPELRVVSF